MRIYAEANLAALIESTDDLIWSVDARYRLITFNRAFKQYFELHFGGPVAPGIGMHELLPPARAVLWFPLYDRALRGEKFRAELPLSDGRILELAFNPIVTDNDINGISVFGKDITERKRTTKALEESEARFRTFFEENSLVMFLADPETGEIVAANRAACAYYGYPAEQFIGMFTRQISLSPPEQTLANRHQALRKECSSFYYSHRLASGEVREIEMHSSPFVVGGKPLLCAIVTDITERKRAEIELRNGEERYRATFEQAAVGILHTSFEGRFLRCNRRFAAIVGYSQEEVADHSFQQITPPEDMDFALAVLDHLVSGAEETEVWEKRYIRKDGTLTWVKMTVSIQRDGTGRPLHFIAFVEDINARKVFEEQLAAATMLLKENEERYRAAFQTTPDAVNISRMSDGAILDINQRFMDLTGYTREELVGRTTLEICLWVNPADREGLIELLRRDGELRNAECQFRKKNGEIFWGRLSASMLEIGGESCLLSFARDITKERTSQAQLTRAAEALRSSEERYRAAFETTPDAVIINRLEDGVIIDVNQRFHEFSGFQRAELIGSTSLQKGIWANPEDRARLVERIRAEGECRNLEFQFRRKNGVIFWARLAVSLLEIGGEPCLLSFARDITEERASKERLAASTGALQASEKRYKTIFQTNPDAVTIARMSDGTYLDCNQGFLNAMGYRREEVIGRSSLELGIWVNPLDRQNLVNTLLQNSHCSGLECQFKRKNGEVLWASISASEIEIDGIPCLLSIVRDISLAKAAESAIRNLAYYDPLTGLPNRRLLLERVRQTLVTSHNIRSRALLFVDLDDFKTLNDTLGHPIGDLLLQQAAERITACHPGSGEVYRLGGDEFVVMLKDLSGMAEEAVAGAVGKNIVASLGLPYQIDNRECLLGACIGIALFGDQECGADEILQRANIALHQAKISGRSTICFFSPALQTAVNARAALEESLRQAIKTEQFLLHFQPQIQRGRVTGAEALIRWNHPQRGLVPPNEFIPMAEETRMILPLGDWALEAACRQIAAWAGRSETAHLSLAVNISALQFRQPDFVHRVLGTLDRTGASPKNLRLELTESILVENIEEVIARMAELRLHGLSFSLDDFGTGYSSLAYLKRLPLDELKIDRVFVHDMLVDATSGAIAQTIIALGRAMGLSVMAEGVETEEQRGFLAALGCHSFQGYLFSRPLPIEDFENFIENFARSSAESRR